MTLGCRCTMLLMRIHTHRKLLPLRLHIALAWLGAFSACIGSASADPGEISGELKQWHKITLTLQRPTVRETENAPNPVADYRLTVTFTHESVNPSYQVPGYFA